MNQPDRRIFQRFEKNLPFTFEWNEEVTSGITVNTSSGGALLQLPISVDAGHRLQLSIGSKKADESPMLLAMVESVHSAIPVGDEYRVGIRWLELRTGAGEEVIRTFLERVLGMVNVHIREVSKEGNQAESVFEFPSFFFRSANPHAKDLADLLEPPSAAEVQAVHEERILQEGGEDISGTLRRMAGKTGKGASADGSAGAWGRTSLSGVRRGPNFNPLGSSGSGAFRERMPSWTELELHLRGISARSRVGRQSGELQDPDELARRTTASTRNVPNVVLDVRGQGQKWKGHLTRVGFMSIDLCAVSDLLPKTYQRVTAFLPLASGPNSRQVVKIAGTVSRIKEDGRFTIRISRVDEGGQEGLFEAFVSVLIESDTAQPISSA